MFKFKDIIPDGFSKFLPDFFGDDDDEDDAAASLDLRNDNFFNLGLDRTVGDVNQAVGGSIVDDDSVTVTNNVTYNVVNSAIRLAKNWMDFA